MIFFLRSAFAQTFFNEYVVYRIWKSKVVPGNLKPFITLLYGIEIAMYFTGLIFSDHLPFDVYAAIQKISGIWIIFQVYLIAVILFFDLLFYLNKKRPFLSRVKVSTLKQARVYSFIGLIFFIWTELYLGYGNYLHPQLGTQEFSFNKPENDSSARPLKTYKMLVASDLHLGYIIDKTMLERYVALINHQQADIVVIDGDLIDYDLKPLIDQKMDVELRKIKAPKGVFFIPGNHDYKFDYKERLAWIASCGMTVLKDSVVTIDNTLVLIGRDDRSRDESEEGRMSFDDLVQKADTTKPCILLAHQPGDIPDACRHNIPLTICGHTHGGQAFPMNLLGHIMYSNTYGTKKDVSGCTSYTTSGLGLSGFPLRIATRSEVVVFNINIY